MCPIHLMIRPDNKQLQGLKLTNAKRNTKFDSIDSAVLVFVKLLESLTQLFNLLLSNPPRIGLGKWKKLISYIRELM